MKFQVIWLFFSFSLYCLPRSTKRTRFPQSGCWLLKKRTGCWLLKKRNLSHLLSFQGTPVFSSQDLAKYQCYRLLFFLIRILHFLFNQGIFLKCIYLKVSLILWFPINCGKIELPNKNCKGKGENPIPSKCVSTQ